MKPLIQIEFYEPGESIPSYCQTTETDRDPLKLASRLVRWVNYIWSLPGGVDLAISRVHVYRLAPCGGREYLGERRGRRS
jgi:hypothetical protein